MENNFSSTVIPSQYNNTQTNSHNKHPQKVFYIICAIILVLLVIGVIIAIAVNSNSPNEEAIDDQNEYSSIVRNDTPMLQLYASLSETMTIGELENTVANQYPNIELHVDNDGTGRLSSNNSRDYIAFYYDWVEDENTPLTIEYEVSEIDDYDRSLLINDIQYIYEPESIKDAGLSIGYSEDDNRYYVDVLYEVFDFATKQEAIEAYLSDSYSN